VTITGATVRGKTFCIYLKTLNSGPFRVSQKVETWHWHSGAAKEIEDW